MEHYYKEIDWLSIGCMFLFVMFMFVLSLLPAVGSIARLIAYVLILAFLLLMFSILIIGGHYRLSVSKDKLTERRFLRKPVDFDLSELERVCVSIDACSIMLVGKNETLKLHHLGHFDALVFFLSMKPNVKVVFNEE